MKDYYGISFPAFELYCYDRFINSLNAFTKYMQYT